MADEILSQYTQSIEALTLIPSSGGRFEVTVNGSLIYSKLALERHAEPGEVSRLLAEKMGVQAKA